MKATHLLLLPAACLAFAVAGAAHARTPSSAAAASAAEGKDVADAHPASAQHSKMKACNDEARTKDVHGADRRAFMKQCLSAKPHAADAS